MTPTGIKEKIIAERAGWIEEMLRGIAALQLESYEQFIGTRAMWQPPIPTSDARSRR